MQLTNPLLGWWNDSTWVVPRKIRYGTARSCWAHCRQILYGQEGSQDQNRSIVRHSIATCVLRLISLEFSYKQNKVNLLREQSEGYSKLTAELTSSVGSPHSATTGLPTESLATTAERARQVWERVLSLIGHFDLDPNRALDIFLDVFSTHLATNYTFFLSLLSLSPWAPPRVTPETPESRPEPDYSGKDLDEILLIAESRSNAKTCSDSSRGSTVLAQVLGFKFSHYHVWTFSFFVGTISHFNSILTLPRARR